MNRNRQRDMTPYPMGEKPCRQNPLLMPLVWGGSKLLTLGSGLRVERVGMEGLRPPYLVLAQHQGFTDYYIAPLAFFPHRACYVSDVEGFAHFGKRLYRQLGCIPVRRFPHDPRPVRNLHHAAHKLGQIVVVYPEARHSNVGTATQLTPATAKLVRHLGLPVVVLTAQGSYLRCPVWDEQRTRKAPLRARLERVLEAEEAAGMTDEAILAKLAPYFAYDEYAWQRDEGIQIDDLQRAAGLHRVLYLCPECGAERMASGGDSLHCADCGRVWRMDEYGGLQAAEGETRFSHIPDWYEYQRERVAAEIDAGRYMLEGRVRIEALPSHRGFVPLGEGRLTHTPEGFTLGGEGLEAPLRWRTSALPSLHNEYDYHGKGDAVVLSTRDCCYYLYPLEAGMQVTKVQLAVEELYKRHRSKMRD